MNAWATAFRRELDREHADAVAVVDGLLDYTRASHWPTLESLGVDGRRPFTGAYWHDRGERDPGYDGWLDAPAVAQLDRLDDWPASTVNASPGTLAAFEFATGRRYQGSTRDLAAVVQWAACLMIVRALATAGGVAFVKGVGRSLTTVVSDL